ncbi:retrovirus polyprotein, putative [Pseudogulbenkiania sp. NH8B]|uniref:hypothetical protein n=1 Tax=Pseudogulbenkiania sp. (strain NH8B) TaxID=748280 RepID=UPI000227990D|nr:hypothetical protein [Pseudogulbenkiania sp. NH8B]BAK77908.1 retrovirus polyprotein, putative [Pseudogulbenkiania sp. NH8B]
MRQNAISQVIANALEPDIASDFSLISNRSGPHYTHQNGIAEAVSRPRHQIKQTHYAFVLIKDMSLTKQDKTRPVTAKLWGIYNARQMVRNRREDDDELDR